MNISQYISDIEKNFTLQIERKDNEIFLLKQQIKELKSKLSINPPMKVKTEEDILKELRMIMQ